ncbi:hypothetical protein [uncultured Apibacter sp.]|uniref:hypothetical protein n=1 Tax=uncultured Apibacter sp. TaxID=1778616 RepID=UPI0025F96E0A|nr:hypothetical protein [uncultured Apibacter sp.]
MNFSILIGFYKSNFITCLLMSLIMVSFFNLFILLIADNLVDVLVDFHQKNNASNLNKNPIKYVIENKEKIKQFYRILIFLASIFMFYAIWFKME